VENYKDEDWLRREYVEKRRDGTDIADEFDVHHQNVYYYLNKFDIERRSRGFRGGEEHPNFKDAKEEYECPWCGTAFRKRPSDISDDIKRGPYCSKDCLNSHRSEFATGEGNHQYGIRGDDNPSSELTREKNPMFGVRGEEHPNWKGGYEQSWRQGAEWRNARKDALERDGYECVECGMGRETHKTHFDRDLEVHHITPVSDGGEKYDRDNLESLCVPCHKQRHREL